MSQPVKILGIVGSDRRMGNTELLVKEALHSGKVNGATVELLRLTDFQFRPCKGCLQCLFASKECSIEDDALLFFTILSEFDGIIVGAPTYVMFPPGLIKTIIDRGGLFISKKERLRDQKGAIITTAGLKGWDHFTIPMLSMFLYSMNSSKMDIVDRISTYAPGPGQVLLDNKNMEAASELGLKVLNAVRGEHVENAEINDRCPICTSQFFIIEENKIICPICLAEAAVTGKAIMWSEESLKNHRYTNSAIERFVNEWIRASKPIYNKEARKILDIRQKYKNQNMGIKWITKDECIREESCNDAHE